MFRSLILAVTLTAAPALADNPWGVIIYAKNKSYSATIRAHEIGHIACPWWRHPARLKADGTDYKPPKGCNEAALKRRGVELIEQPVSMKEARERCQGNMGCSNSPEIQASLGN